MKFVLRTFPNHLAVAVPQDVTIEIYFVIDIVTDTILPQNVILLNVEEQRSESITLEYRNKVLLIKPENKLSPNTHYQIELVGGKNGIKDITGRFLEQSYLFEFYTADVDHIKPPVLTAPAHQTSLTGPVSFAWNAAEKAYFYELEISRSNTFDVLVWPRGESRVYETQVTPDISYEPGNYYARIRTVNHSGEKSSYSKPIQFYVEKSSQHQHPDPEPPNGSDPGCSDGLDEELEQIKDELGGSEEEEESLNVVSMTPADQEVNVPISYDITNNPLTEIVVEFDDDLDLSTINSSSFYVIAQRN
jgi:hypothetical protein